LIEKPAETKKNKSKTTTFGIELPTEFYRLSGKCIRDNNDVIQ
jgi:hypothetical protein